MTDRKKLMVGTPMHGGTCYGAYANACLNLLNTLNGAGVEVLFYFLYDDALVPRARDTIVDVFLQTDCTHLLFIDADIEFKPEDVLSVLMLDEAVVGGPYAKKHINWDNVVSIVRQIPTISPDDIQRFAGDYVFHAKEPIVSTDALCEVDEVGTGFMMIRRDVFFTFQDAYPQLCYKEDGRYRFSFFPTFIDNHGSPTNGGTDRYLSEDYAFCALWKKAGGKIMLAPWVVLKHIGNYSYICDLNTKIDSSKQEKL